MWDIARVGNMLWPPVMSPGCSSNWWTVCRMVDACFGGLSCSQWWHWRGRVGKGMKESPSQQLPSGFCGHSSSSDRVLEEWGPCCNLCISQRCSCVQGDIATLSETHWGWKYLSARLHKLSFLSTHMCRRHIRAKQHREVNSMSQHGREMELVKSLPQRSLAPNHAPKMLTQLWVVIDAMRSTLCSLQVTSTAFDSQRDHAPCWLVLRKYQNSAADKRCQMRRASGELPAHSWWSFHCLKSNFFVSRKRWLSWIYVVPQCLCFWLMAFKISFKRKKLVKWPIVVLPAFFFFFPVEKSAGEKTVTQKIMKLSFCEFTVFHI